MPALLCERPAVSHRATKPSALVLNTIAESIPTVPETESGTAYSAYTLALRVAEENGDFDAACKVLARWFGTIAVYHAKAAAEQPGVECDLQFWPMCQKESKTALAIYRNAGKETRAAVYLLEDACLPHYAQALASGEYTVLGL